MQTSDSLLTDKQVADRLNCSTRHVHRLVERGALPEPRKVGALVRWRASEIDAWIAADSATDPKQGATR